MNPLYEILLCYPAGDEHGVFREQPLSLGGTVRLDGIEWKVFAQAAAASDAVLGRYLCRPATEQEYADQEMTA